MPPATVPPATAAAPAEPAPPSPRGSARRGASPGRFVAVVAVLIGIAAAGLLTLETARGLGWEPFFDEMWRLDLIRSSTPFDQFVSGVTPLPPGWTVAFRLVEPVLGISPTGYRLVTFAIAGAGIGLLVVLLSEWCRPRERDAPSEVVALATAAAAALSVTVFALVAEVVYFNQYLVEVTYAVALTTACVLLGRHRAAFPCFLAGAAVAPLFTIAPLALLPALVLAAGWWAVKSEAELRARRTIAVAVAGAVALFLALGLYLGLYRFMGNADLSEGWSKASVTLSLRDPLRVGDTLRLVRDGVLGDTLSTGVGAVFGSVVVALAFAVGAVTITRRWAWYPLLVGSGWVAVLVGSALTGGPVTPVRVTVGFYWIVLATIALGAFHGVAWLVGRARTPFWSRVAAIGVALVAVAVALWPAGPPYGATEFARGLLADLDPIVESRARDNLVVTYHFMGHAYTHDRFVNRPPAGRAFVVVGQRDQYDRRIYDVDALVRRHLPDGGVVWCVIPYALGPKNGGRACNVGGGARPLGRVDGAQAIVIAYRIPR